MKSVVIEIVVRDTAYPSHIVHGHHHVEVPATGESTLMEMANTLHALVTPILRAAVAQFDDSLSKFKQANPMWPAKEDDNA